MLRLRHIPTGDVYGWNKDMAKQPDMEEFDDEDPNAEVPQTEKTNPVQGKPPKSVVGDDATAVMDEAIRKAAEQGETEVTTAETSGVAEDEAEPEEYILVDEAGVPVLDTEGNQIPTDAEGNQLNAEQVPATPEPPEEPKKKGKR